MTRLLVRYGDLSTPRRWLAAAAVTVAGFLAWTAPAQATITQANVTSPADGSLLLDNEVSNPNGTFTVTGTTNSTDPAADTVDIGCYNGGTRVGNYQGPSNAGVSLNPDGSFSASVPLSDLAPGSCALLAVPHPASLHAGPSYTGPRVGLSQFETLPVGSGPNANDVEDYIFWDQTLSGSDGTASVSDCGPFDQLYDGSPAMNGNGSASLFDCAGNLYGAQRLLGLGNDQTRAEILVDGNNAYASNDANNLTATSASNANFPALSVTLDRFDQSTGAAQTTEREPLVECSPNDVYKPTQSDCSSFVSSGVSFTRITDYAGNGRLATVTDTYTSTDGNSHALDLEYEQDLQASTSGWMLPGENSFAQHATGDTAGPPPSAPATIYAIADTTNAPSFTNPVGALTFTSAYNSIRFDDTLFGSEQSALIDYQRSVPAGGSVSIQWSYADGMTLAEVQNDADAVQGPAIAISSPSPGAALASSRATVTGTASAGSGVRTVTVNGVPASLSGSTFSASIPLSPGTNTITATVTSTAGNTSSASESVSYVPPVAAGSPIAAPVAPAPAAATGSASKIQSSTARLSGIVTSDGAGVSYYFQYGPTAAYGHQTKSVALPAGTAAVTVSADVSGLKAHTTYHYRLLATGAGGTSSGADRTFKTLWALKALAVKVSPHRDATAPYSYAVSGSLKLPRGVTRRAGCTGTVTMLVKHGAKKLVARVIHVRRDCTYSSAVSFSTAKLKGRGTISFTLTFNGNRTLGTRKANAVRATYG